MPKKLTQRSGFGLLEVLLATAIFIVVVGSMVTLSRLSLRNAALAAHRTQAMNLAEDGLEIIRQMRDTNWIDGVTKRENNAQVAPTESWLAFKHNCPDSDVTSYGVVNRNGLTQYEICFDQTLSRFGLREVTVLNDNSPHLQPDTYIILKDEQGNLDPGSPSWFKRLITFDLVPNTARGTVTDPFPGLQLLANNANNQPALLENAEQHHFVKVKSKVTWRDFDREWSVEASTILTNWRGQ